MALTAGVRLREDGRYPLEESVHQIIFPLRQTSDDIRSDRMNLWIIDEKLAKLAKNARECELRFA